MVKAAYCSGPFEVTFDPFDLQNTHQNLQLLIVLGQLFSHGFVLPFSAVGLLLSWFGPLRDLIPGWLAWCQAVLSDPEAGCSCFLLPVMCLMCPREKPMSRLFLLL